MFKRSMAIALTATLAISSTPQPTQATPAFLLPAGASISATGVGIVIILLASGVYVLYIQGNGDWNPIAETREWHAAATRADCDRLERRFQREGRRVYLVGTRRTNDPVLRYICLFEGEDADPTYVLQDSRYGD